MLPLGRVCGGRCCHLRLAATWEGEWAMERAAIDVATESYQYYTSDHVKRWWTYISLPKDDMHIMLHAICSILLGDKTSK